MSVVDHLKKRGVPLRVFKAVSGRPGTFDPRYVMIHHDASGIGPSPALDDYIARGTSSVPGPLSQFWYSSVTNDSAGQTSVISTGRANHAGRGGPWPGVDGTVAADTMNSYSYGVEWDHTTNESIGKEEYKGLVLLLAALCDYIDVKRGKRHGARRLLAHKEWAPTRKIDPAGVNMTNLRGDVQAKINSWYSTAPAPKPPATGGGTVTISDADAAKIANAVWAKQFNVANYDKPLAAGSILGLTLRNVNQTKAGIELVNKNLWEAVIPRLNTIATKCDQIISKVDGLAPGSVVPTVPSLDQIKTAVVDEFQRRLGNG